MGKSLLPVLLALLVLIAGVNAATFESAADSGTCSIITPSCNAGNHSPLTVNAFGQPNSTICIYFFYGLNCPHCARIEPLITQLSATYKDVQLKPFEVYFNATNQQMFNDFMSRYQIKNPGVPAVFIGDRAFIGETAIKDNLMESIVFFQKNGPICPETYKKVEGPLTQLSPPKNIQLTLPALIGAAAIDSINPCAFAVLIFLLVYISALGSKKKVLKIGITYIVSIFIVYFLSGLGLFTLIQTTHLTKFVYFIAALIAIVAGLINVKDFFWYGKGFTLAIPESRKPVMERYIQKATLPAAIILGVLVSMFELPCTGGVYLAILGLLSAKMTLWQGIPYLILYNVIFVLPLFVILIAIYKGMSAEKAEKWRLGNRRWMKLAMGLMMIALGVIMLLGWI